MAETAIILAAIAATTAAAGSAVMQGQMAASQANTQAQVADYNATVQRQNAKLAGEVGASQEAQVRRSSTGQEGAQFAAIAQSGTGVTSGSAVDVLRQQAINDQLDALNIRYEGQLNARNYNIQAQQYATQADIYRSNAKQEMLKGYAGAGSELLKGGADYFAKGGKLPGIGGYGGYGLSGITSRSLP